MFTLRKSLLFFAKVSVGNLNWLNMVSSVNPPHPFLVSQTASGRVLVWSFHELDEHTNSMLVLQPSEKEDGTGPVTVRCFFWGARSKVTANLVAGCPIFNTRLFKQSRSSSFTLYCRSVRCVVSNGSSNPRGSCSNQFILVFFAYLSNLI